MLVNCQSDMGIKYLESLGAGLLFHGPHRDPLARARARARTRTRTRVAARARVAARRRRARTQVTSFRRMYLALLISSEMPLRSSSLRRPCCVVSAVNVSG